MPLIAENKENYPILIVDRLGFLGSEIAKKLFQDSTVVLVTQNNPPPLDNLIHIPFNKKIPKIPDNIYSHIFVFDDEEDITMEFLSTFLKKAQEDKAVFCFLTNIKNKDEVPSELFDYKKTRVVFYGDIFPAANLYPKSYINRFLIQSKNRGRIDVPDDGMGIIYPIFLEDAILGILEASFGTSSDKIYYLLPKYGVTLLTLAHMIQKNDPGIIIDFSQEPIPQIITLSKEGRYLLDEKYPLEDRIKNLKIQAGHFEKKEEYSKKRAWEKNKSFFTDYKLFLYSIIFFLFLPVLSTLLFSFVAFFSLSRIQISASNSGLFFNLSRSSFNLAQNFSRTLNYELGFLKIGLMEGLVVAIDKGRGQTESISDYYSAKDSFLNGRTADGINSLKNFLIFAQQERNLKIVDPSMFNFISQTINIWPQVLAINSKKTYLIIFQDNSIPRPTGGLIQSFGLLTLDNGRISDFKIYNAESADKNLKGHVEPPFAIRRYLPSQHWFLKDSNFNPDFKESAASSAFFVNLEEGKQVDGVIGVDLTFLQKFTNLKENLSLDDVSSLTNELKRENIVDFLLSKNFANLVDNKDVVFEFNDQSIENIFDTNNYSSAIFDTRSNSPKTINDFIGNIESDLGKQAVKINRKEDVKVNISDGGNVSTNVSLIYKNLGDSDYKNYLRFILPEGAVIQKIKIDGNGTDFTDAVTDPSIYESKGFVPPQKLEVERYDQNGKSFFGFIVVIPRGQTKSIEVDYSFASLPSASSLSDFSYNLQFFKQPGVEPYPFNFSISYPPSFKTSSSSLSKIVDRDFDINLNFFKK